jgi:phage terminase small subunit
MKMSTNTKVQAKTAPTIRGKRKRPPVSVPRPTPAAAEGQAELLPVEDTYERALAAVRTERSRAFVQELVRTFPQLDGKAAALAVGCSPGIAKKTASIWRHRPDIARAVNLWIRERVEKSLPPSAASPERQAEQVLRTAWLVAKANVMWFSQITEDGRNLVADLNHCTDEQLAVIESFDVVERVVGEVTVERRTRLKLKDSSRALAILARATGLEEKSEPATRNVVLTVVYDGNDRLRQMKQLRELGELNPDEAATKPDEVTDPMESIPSAKKFPIN